jgi:hypothetical protein
MNIPVGYSRWVNQYDENSHGLYHLTDLKFDSDLTLKPICEIKESGVLNWNTSNFVKNAYLDNETIKYLKKYFGLASFNVVKGLISYISIKGDHLFGKYVSTLFKEKANQDLLKKENKHNPAYRETSKLFMNAITGKFVENTDKYNDISFCLRSDDKKQENINGCGIRKTPNNEDTENKYMLCGVSLYFYSKMLLFEYIRQLPNQSKDVIHIETDSIYFPKKQQNHFIDNLQEYKGDYPVKIGDELGNVKQEKDCDEPCYFLGKKFYLIGDILRIKGIPLSTIDDWGNKINLVDSTLYETIYNGESVRVQYKSLVKCLYGDTRVCEVINHRTVKPSGKMSLYIH